MLTEKVGSARVVVRRATTTAASLSCILKLDVGSANSIAEVASSCVVIVR